MRTHSPGPEKEAGAGSTETWRLPLQGRAILCRSPKSRLGQANAAGKGRSQAEAAPHRQPGSGALTGWAGRGCGSRPPPPCSRGRSRRSAPAGSEHPALAAAEAADCQFSVLSFCLTEEPGGDFHLSTRGLSRHVTQRGERGRRPGLLAGRGRSRPAGPRPAPSPRPPPAPHRPRGGPARRGVSPRESPGHFGSGGQRHIHVEIAVMGTGNEIGSFFSAVFLQKINCGEPEGK